MITIAVTQLVRPSTYGFQGKMVSPLMLLNAHELGGKRDKLYEIAYPVWRLSAFSGGRGDSAITTAIPDRILHKSEVFHLSGDSYRLKHRETIFGNS